MSQLRNFEISIWTLQDDFITTIESAWIKTKGKTQDASMNLNIDGTQQLTFSVPMYYFINGQKISNPAWITFSDNKVLLNTRKVKVILNKKTDDEEIYEFVIDKVTERHEQDELFCDVECSGLAFYELGKIGYKVSLSEDDFYNDDYSWFSGETDSDGNLLFENQPVANIQYWLNKFLKPYSNEDFSAAQWYYKIQMNWDLTASFAEFEKDSDKIYENDVYEDAYSLSQEKYRMINLEESNFYNLTQNIAETFGVYCKYVYSYDENYHIIGRTIIFYNNFLNEEKLSINYRGNTQSISRELDTTDLITKMYVKSVDNSGEAISIIDVDENELGEDYLLNFDYLHSIGSIDDDDYNEIEPFKNNLKILNIQLKSVSEEIINIESKLPGLRARVSLAEDSIQLDKEKINSGNKLLTNLTNGTNILEITNKNPDTVVLLPESNISDGTNTGYYYVKITRLGVDLSTLKIYKKISLVDDSYNLDEEDEIKTGIPVYDEAGNLVKITNIYWTQQDEESSRSKIVYLTYSYSPKLYYENVIKAWQNKLNKDKQEFDEASATLVQLENQLRDATNRQKELIKQKNELNTTFERIMGPAIREGYWQPDDYSEYAQTFVSNYDIGAESEGTSHYDKFIWDDQLFDEELTISYEEGVDQQIKYYPCIALTNEGQSIIWDEIKNHLNSYSFIFFDTDSSEKRNATTLRTLSFGSGARIIFLKRSAKGQNNYGAPAPYLLLPGLESYLESSINNAKNYSLIGEIEYDNNNINGYVITGGDDGHGIEINSSWWIDFSTYDYKPVYPRIRIESSSLKTDTNSLIISDNGLYNNPVVLTQYADYYINNRVEESQYLIISLDNDTIHPLVTTYYITIKPEIIAKTSQLNNHILKIMFQLSNYGVAIYRDAKEILKDNSKPKVSYASTIDIFNKDVIKRPSYFLSKIVKINDYELLLDNAWGYISEVTLDLDHPENDNIEIQNYTNKFEDLFTTIVAQTEEMKKTGYLINSLSNSFAPDGTLNATTLRNSLSKVDLNYAFNNGTLNIDEANGIWGISDNGVVAFRGGGIFTATERDKRNNWVWNTGITPEGINADLLTSGQLDTNKIRVFAGDRERFQLNGEGLYAYKTFLSDFDVFTRISDIQNFDDTDIEEKIEQNDTLDPTQFVRFDENGLFLVAKEGAYVLNENKTAYIPITEKWPDSNGVLHNRLDTDNELKRVSISWDGLSLRNLKGERVFYADSNTGDLKIKGSMYADAFYVITKNGDTEISNDIATFINNTSLTELQTRLKNNTDVGARIKAYINAAATSIGGRYIKTVDDGTQKYTEGTSAPSNPNINDIFYNTSQHKTYICVATSGSNMWEEVQIANGENAKMVIDSTEGTINFRSTGFINFRTTASIALYAIDPNSNNHSILSISTYGISMESNKNISIRGGEINITSAIVNGNTIKGKISITSGGEFSAVGSSFWLASIDYNTYNSYSDKNSVSFIHGYLGPIDNKYHIDMGSDNIRIMSNGSLTLESGGSITLNNAGNDDGKITLMNGDNDAIELSKNGISMLSDATLKVDTANFKLRPDLVFANTSDSYNNVFFYVGANFNASNTNPSHYIKYSYAKGLQIKTTNFSLDPTATNGATIFNIGNTTNYIKYTSNGLDIRGNLTIGGINNNNGTFTLLGLNGEPAGIWNNEELILYKYYDNYEYVPYDYLSLTKGEIHFGYNHEGTINESFISHYGEMLLINSTEPIMLRKGDITTPSYAYISLSDNITLSHPSGIEIRSGNSNYITVSNDGLIFNFSDTFYMNTLSSGFAVGASNSIDLNFGYSLSLRSLNNYYISLAEGNISLSGNTYIQANTLSMNGQSGISQTISVGNNRTITCVNGIVVGYSE